MSNFLCDEEQNWCPISGAGDCADAAAHLGFLDSNIQSIDRDNRPPGCFASANDNVKFNQNADSEVGQGGGRLIFCRNCDDVTTAAPTTQEPTTTERDYYSTAVGEDCADEEFCAIQTLSQCADAAAALDFEEPTSVDREDRPRGCFRSPAGAVRFNTNSDTVIELDAEQTSICMHCSFTSTAEPTTSTPASYIVSDGSYCSDEDGYCQIGTREGCAQAALSLGLSDTTVGVAFARSDRPAACFTSAIGSLRFNDNLQSAQTAHSSQTLLCVLCSMTTTTTTTTTEFVFFD